MKMTVFWDDAQCSLVETEMMKAVCTSKMSINFYKTTWCNIKEDSHLLCAKVLKHRVTLHFHF
jgi:hypothetical protein